MVTKFFMKSNIKQLPSYWLNYSVRRNTELQHTGQWRESAQFANSNKTNLTYCHSQNLVARTFGWFIHRTMGIQHFYGKGPHKLLWAASRAASGKTTVTCILNCTSDWNCSSVCTFYKCVREPYNATWWADCWRTKQWTKLSFKNC